MLAWSWESERQERQWSGASLGRRTLVRAPTRQTLASPRRKRSYDEPRRARSRIVRSESTVRRVCAFANEREQKSGNRDRRHATPDHDFRETRSDHRATRYSREWEAEHVLALPLDSDVDLLPLDDPQWDWKDFERFCLGFVKAQPGVRDARLYGTRGQDQRGIDIVADLEDGGTRTYQCRKWRAYRKADAEHTVEETEYEADEHVILAGCEVGTAVRDYIDGVESWSLLDKEDLSRAVREIEPRERARRLIEDTFSVAWRRAFLGPPGPLGFWETEDY